MKKALLLLAIMSSSVFAGNTTTVQGDLTSIDITVGTTPLTIKIIKTQERKLKVNPKTMFRFKDCLDGEFEIEQATINEDDGYESYNVLSSSCEE